MLLVAAFLLALPFLPAQSAALALFVLTAVTVFRPTPPQHGVSGSVLVFLAAEIVAALRSPVPAQAIAVLSFFLPGLILFYLMTQRRDWPLRHWALVWGAFCAVLSLSVVVGWVRLRLGAHVPPEMDVPQASLLLSGNQLLLVPNDICASAVGISFPCMLLALPGRGAMLRVAAVLAVLLTLLAMAILRTRSGFAIVTAELLLALGFWRPRGVFIVLSACTVLAAGAYFVVGVPALHRLVSPDTLEDHGIAGRLGLWVSAWRMFLMEPVLGHGAQSFGLEHGTLLPAWSPRSPERRVLWAHSLYFETLAEQGLVGIAALLCLLLRPVPLLWHFAGAKTAMSERCDAVFAAAAVFGFLLAGAVELSFERRVVSLMMLGVVGFAWRAAEACVTARTHGLPQRGALR
jgi:O-antigen ligase